MKYRYGNAWEEHPIRPGEVWGLPDGSRLAVHNLFAPLPAFMLKADLVFIDPPWNQGNLTAFYTKAERDDYPSWDDFQQAVIQRMEDISPAVAYIEMGNRFADHWQRELSLRWPVVQRWPVVYYRKHPTTLLRAASTPIAYDFTGMDEAKAISLIAQIEQYTIMGDMCMGQGLVGLAAYKAGKPFVGTELNPRRLAVLIQKLVRQGAAIARLEHG